MFKLVTIVFIWILSPLIINSQNVHFVQYDTEDGLASNEVYDIEIGAHGKIWISTDRGACIYDGYDFKTFTTNDGLADNTNFNIYKDINDNLWFLGYSNGLSIYHANKFESFSGNEELRNIIIDNQYGWVQDIFPLGNDLLMFFSKNTSNEMVVIESDDQINQYALTPIHSDFFLKELSGSFFSAGDLKFYLPHTEKSKSFKYASPCQVIDVKGDSLFHHNSFVYFKNRDKERWNEFDLKVQINDLFVSTAGKIFVLTVKGVVSLSLSEDQLNSFPSFYFESEHVTSMKEDLEGNYWIGTLESGVFFVPTFEINRLEYDSYSPSDKALTLASFEEQLYVGTSKGKIVVVNKEMKPEVMFESDRDDHQIGFLERNNDSLILATGKLHIHKKHPTQFKKFSKRPIIDKILANGSILTYGTNSFYLNFGSTRIFASHQLERPLDIKITKVIQDTQENIWFGTFDGLYLVEDYDYINWTKVLSEKDDPFGRINDIDIDRYDNKWISTIGKGLFYQTVDSIFGINQSDGLLSNLINQSMLFNDSIVFVASNKGFDYFSYDFAAGDLKISEIRNLTFADGIHSNFINDLEYWNGQIWLATNKGVNHFNPDILFQEFVETPVIIEEFKVIDSLIETPKEITLKHFENDISINFTGVGFRKDDSNDQYKYRLIKNDAAQNWSYSKDKNVRFNDLPFGEYVFQVCAKNRSGEYNVEPASIGFQITPHLFNRWWFRLLTVLLIIALLSLWVRSYIKDQKIKEIEKRKLKEAELKIKQSELSSLRNQMNPHFVYNSLNSIQNYIFNKDPEQASYYLTKFSDLMRSSLKYSKQEWILLEEEIEYLQAYLELEKMRFGNLFTYEIKIDDNIEIDYLKIPPLLIQPLVENSVKHAFKEIRTGGEIRIFFESLEEDKFKITVEDNGRGYDAGQIVNDQTANSSFGSSIVKERIEIINASYDPPQASVQFLNLSDLDTKTTGFKVVLILPVKY